MTGIPLAPQVVPDSIGRGIAMAAAAWYDDALRPRVDTGTLACWSALLEEWSNATDLPLLVRKARENRGQVLVHGSGRILVPTDNSPAHWSLALAYSGICPSLDDVRVMLNSDCVPVAMVITAAERLNARYKCTRQSTPGPNQQGWKVAHVQGIGLGYVGRLEEISLETLQEHFKNFLSPANMFLIPKAYAGLGETPEFINTFRQRAGGGV